MPDNLWCREASQVIGGEGFGDEPFISEPFGSEGVRSEPFSKCVDNPKFEK